MKRVRMTGIAALLLACCAQLAGAAAAAARDADPALWLLKDADTTIYLFGTIHVLPPGLAWFDEAVARAFDAAEELRMEVVLPDDPAALAPVMMRYALDAGGEPLSAKLNAQQLATYRAGMARLGLPAEQLEAFEPWFVSLQISVAMIAARGMDPSHGVEQVLHAAALAQGKRLTGFETIDEQMACLDSTPQDEQIVGMMTALEDGAQAEREIDGMVASWARGEPERTAELLNESLKDTPVSARLLLADRNRRWAESLRARMAEPGTVFVAVGAGHLAGRDSLQDFLARLGLRVERVRY
jgi:uncharacterized protein YbaP (TraB family)